MREQVLKTIKKYNLINEGDKVVIGVSGGPDSMCLLHLLNSIKKNLCILRNDHIYQEHIYN